MTTRLLRAAAQISPTLEVELDDWMSDVDHALAPFETEEVDHGVILAE